MVGLVVNRPTSTALGGRVLVNSIRPLAAVCVGEVVLTLLCAVRIDPLGDRVPMDTEGFRRVRNALFVSGESLLNVEFFKLVERFIQQDVAVEHVFDYCF